MAVGLVVFDMDGTLVDGQQTIIYALSKTLAEAGYPVPEIIRLRRTIGLSPIDIFQDLLPSGSNAVWANLAYQFKKIYQDAISSGDLLQEALYDGVIETLSSLTHRGILCGIATGKSRRGVARVFKTHGIGTHFVTTQTADDHPGKPCPDMLLAAIDQSDLGQTHVLMVGDTTFDMQMAVNAQTSSGCPNGIIVSAIGVSWGYHSVKDLKAAGAQHILNHVSDLEEIIQSVR